jgi:hypothetical protein
MQKGLSWKEAYDLLFVIGRCLRKYISEKVTAHYEVYWEEVAPRIEFNSPLNKPCSTHNFPAYYPYFSPLSKCISSYFFELCTKLNALYPIPNRFVHHGILPDEKFEKIRIIAGYVIEFLRGNWLCCINKISYS